MGAYCVGGNRFRRLLSVLTELSWFSAEGGTLLPLAIGLCIYSAALRGSGTLCYPLFGLVCVVLVHTVAVAQR